MQSHENEIARLRVAIEGADAVVVGALATSSRPTMRGCSSARS